jgi:pSer/pThr/pTyr-binding forkhead associated (FHA) protein
MADSSKTAPSANQSVLLPQGEHAGKSALPLGSHAFTLIGSRNRAHLHLLSSTVSRNHACIVTTKSGMYIRDLASRGGVIVNSRRVKELDLQDGDIIQIGSFKFKFQEPLGAIHLSTTAPPPLAMLEMAGRTLTPLDDRTVLIGRRSTCDIPIDSASVSSSHAIIFESDGRRFIRDLGSRTGTQVNGTTVHQQALQVGDQIQIGDVRFRYVTTSTPIEEAEEVPEAQSIPVEDEVAEDLKSDAEVIAAHADIDDDLVPVPVPTDAEEEFGAEPIDEEPLEVDDELAVPKEPIAHEAAPAEHEDLLPVEADEEEPAAPVASAPQKQPEVEPVPVSVQDDVIESKWGPLDFTSTQSPLESLAVTPALEDRGMTSSVGAVETGEDMGLDFWAPEDDHVVTSEAPPAIETPAITTPVSLSVDEASQAVELEPEPLAAETPPLVPESTDDAIDFAATVGPGPASLDPAPAAAAEVHPSATDVELDAFEAALLELDAPPIDHASGTFSPASVEPAPAAEVTQSVIAPFDIEDESFAAEAQPEPLASVESREEPEPFIPATPIVETPAVGELTVAEAPAGWDNLELLDEVEIEEEPEIVADSESIEWPQAAEPAVAMEEAEWETVEDSEWIAAPAPELPTPVEPEPAPALELSPAPEPPVADLPPLPTVDAELAFEQQPPPTPVAVDLTHPTPPLELESPAAVIEAEPTRVSKWARPREPEEILADLPPLAPVEMEAPIEQLPPESIPSHITFAAASVATEPEPVADIEVEPAVAWEPPPTLAAEPQPVVADLAPISAIELEPADEWIAPAPVTSNVPTHAAPDVMDDVEQHSSTELESPVEPEPATHGFVQTVTYSTAEPESVTTDLTPAAESLAPGEVSDVQPVDEAPVAPLPEVEVTASHVSEESEASVGEIDVADEASAAVIEEPVVFPAAVQVEEVDLSAVKFEAGQAPNEQPGEVLEAPPEASAEPAPLLDLVPRPAVESAPEISLPQTLESVADTAPPVDDAATAETEQTATGKKLKKPRPPRKKAAQPPARQTSRKKRGMAAVEENVAETVSPLGEAPPIEEPLSVEGPTAVAATSAPSEMIESDYAAAELLEPETALAEALPVEPEVAKPQAAAIAELHPVAPEAELTSVESEPLLHETELAQSTGHDVGETLRESEPEELEPTISAVEAETTAFYAGTESDVKPVAAELDSDELELVDEPAAMAEHPEASGSEILSFVAAAETPEAQTVMADWQSAEPEPISFESQPVGTTSEPVVESTEVVAEETTQVTPESVLTASAHEQFVSLEPAPAVDATAPEVLSEPMVTATVHEEVVLPESAPEMDAGLTSTEIIVTSQPIETIENTEPTLESALALEPTLEQVDAPAAEGDLIQVDPALSDTAFGRAVQDFTGSGLGPLVESALATAPAHSEAPAESPVAGEFDSGDAINLDDIEFVSTPTPDDDFGSFAAALEGLVEPESLESMPTETASHELAAGLDTHLDAEFMSEASELSADLSAEVPDQSQSLTGDVVLEHAATMDITPVVSEITVTTTEAIEAPSEPQVDDDEFIPIGEDALLEAFDPEDLLQGELPAIEPEVPPAPESLAEAEAPQGLESPEVAPQEALPVETVVAAQPPVVAEAPVAPQDSIAATPPAPLPLLRPPAAPQAAPPAPTNPYFGMERDLGSFLGGMPLNLPPAVAATPFASGPPQQARPGANLPPPRLSPVSLPSVKAPPESSFKPAVQKPISVQRLGPEQQPGVMVRELRTQQPLAVEKPEPVQVEAPIQEAAAVAPQVPLESSSVVTAAIDASELQPEELPMLLDDEPAEMVDPDDLLFQPEEPLELFDGTADKLDVLPDDFDEIADVSQSLAGSKPAVPAAAARPVPVAAPSAPAPQTLTAAPANVPAGFASGSPSVSAAPPLRSLTADPALSQASAPAASVAVPPFAGTRQDARISLTGFAGIAAGANRLSASDIFSQTTFPPPDVAMFQPQPIDIPPMKVRMPSADASSGGKLSAQQRRPGTAPGQRGAAPAGQFRTKPQAAQAAKPADSKPQAEEKRRKPWWKNIRALLPMLILAMIGAIVPIVIFLPPHRSVQGMLYIDGLDSLNPMDRKSHVQDIRELLKKPDLAATVVGSLQTKGVSLGFTADPAEVAALANPEKSHFESAQNALVLTHRSVDPDTDRKRMHAVLLAAYNESRAPAEAARAAENDVVKESEKKLAGLQAQLESRQASQAKLADDLRAATGASSQELLLNPAAATDKLQHESERLGTALKADNVKVEESRKALLVAQAGSEAALPGFPADSKLAQMKLNLSSLTTRLTSARGLPDRRIDVFANAFAEAVGNADQDLMLLALGSSRDPMLSAYVTSGRQAAADIRDILSRQKRYAEDLMLLRTQLASRRATHLRQVWESDETLKQMMDDRDGQARRYAAAAASDAGSVEDAAKLRAVVDDLDQKIDARRLALATGGQDDVQQTIQQAIDHILSDRKSDMQRIAKDVSSLEVPPVGKLQAGAQGAVTSVGKEVAGVKAAHDQYAAAARNASAKDSNVQMQLLEDDIAEQQARVDAYQRRQSTAAAVAAAWKSLDAAQDAEAKSQAAFATNVNLLASVRELKDAAERVEDSRNALATAQTDLDRQKTAASHTVQVQPPNDAATSIVDEPDQRTWYVIGALCILGAIFGGPIWMSLRESDSNLPPIASFALQHPGAPEADFDPFETATADEEAHPATA